MKLDYFAIWVVHTCDDETHNMLSSLILSELCFVASVSRLIVCFISLFLFLRENKH